jgi:hypothetical protein
MIMGALAFLLVIGAAALKFALFVVLPIWLVWMFASKIASMVCRRRGDDPGGTTRPSNSSTPPPAPADSMDGIDPA